MIRPMNLSDAVWQQLITPITPQNPCGDYLVYEETYDLIQGARFEEDATLPQGIWKRDIKRADWPRVAELCQEALSHKSKDLQIAAWLMEAWTVIHGIQGAVQGLTLIETYCQNFWDTIYPRIKEDDPEFRMAPFDWINQKFSDRLILIPLTLDESTALQYTFLDWQKANQFHERGQGKSNSNFRDQDANSDMTLGRFKTASDATPLDFYQNLAEGLQKSLDLCISIEALIYQKHKEFPSHLNFLKSQIQNLLSTIKIILKDKQPLIDLYDTSFETKQGDSEKAPYGPLKSREEAYTRLGEIADFLARIEPHSPTPFLIRRALSWGRMSVIDLLQEIVKDKGDYQNILQLLGVQKSDNS